MRGGKGGVPARSEGSLWDTPTEQLTSPLLNQPPGTPCWLSRGHSKLHPGYAVSLPLISGARKKLQLPGAPCVNCSEPKSKGAFGFTSAERKHALLGKWLPGRHLGMREWEGCLSVVAHWESGWGILNPEEDLTVCGPSSQNCVHIRVPRRFPYSSRGLTGPDLSPCVVVYMVFHLCTCIQDPNNWQEWEKSEDLSCYWH